MTVWAAKGRGMTKLSWQHMMGIYSNQYPDCAPHADTKKYLARLLLKR